MGIHGRPLDRVIYEFLKEVKAAKSERPLQQNSITRKIDSNRFIGLSWIHAIENVYGYRIDRGEERIGAVKAGHEEAYLLKVDVGFPLLSSRRIACDANGLPIEYGLSLYRADRYVARILTLRKLAVFVRKR